MLGEGTLAAVLNADKVRAIRKSKLTSTELAEVFGVYRGTFAR